MDIKIKESGVELIGQGGHDAVILAALVRVFVSGGTLRACYRDPETGIVRKFKWETEGVGELDDGLKSFIAAHTSILDY